MALNKFNMNNVIIYKHKFRYNLHLYVTQKKFLI